MNRDFSRSQAILISNATFSDEEIQDLPGAMGCAPAMKALLTSDLCGWPSGQVETLQDVAAPPELARKLVGLTEGVQDVLLLYYVGHGIRIPNGQLALALRDTSSTRNLLRHTAMVYKEVADILRGCPATTKLVILDCCHAELGNRASDQFQSADIDAEPVDGLYCIWASKEWENAKSPLSGGLTYFTDAFIDVVRTGIPGKPPQLTIGQVFIELRARLLRTSRPEPAQSVVRDAYHWHFALNAAAPETHLDLEKENDSLLAWKAEAEDRVQVLETEVAERTREVKRLREQAQASESRSAKRQQLFAELQKARTRLRAATTAQVAAQVASRDVGESVNLTETRTDDVQQATPMPAPDGSGPQPAVGDTETVTTTPRQASESADLPLVHTGKTGKSEETETNKSSTLETGLFAILICAAFIVWITDPSMATAIFDSVTKGVAAAVDSVSKGVAAVVHGMGKLR